MSAVTTFLADWAHEFWLILVESGPWLLVGFLLAGVAHAWIPMAWVRKQLGGRGVGSVLKAAAIGVPMPLCSCSVIPAAAALRRHGASKGATAAFAISTPEDGSETIALTWGMLGPVMAIVRPIGAVTSALAAGLLIDASDKRAERRAAEAATTNLPLAQAPSCCSAGTPAAEPAPASCCAPASPPAPASCCASEPPPARGTFLTRVRTALRYAYLDMPADLAGWLLVGLALSAVIGASVPAGWIEAHVGEGIGPMLLMLVVGLPIYVCAAASTPVAAVLVAKGLSPGAALVFLLAGPATNMATMAWALKDLGVRALAIYLACIAAVAVGLGVAIDAIGVEIPSAILPGGHEHGVSPLSAAFAIALGALLALGAANRARAWLRDRRRTSIAATASAPAAA
ncbi:MAG: SO_0444 family Cu/Zn efflux transporter [Phycisphaerales bacterium]